jgi:amidase
VIGPLARSARDLELALGIIVGPDAIDAPAVRIALPKPKPRTWRQWRVAVMDSAETAPVDSAVREGIGRVTEFLRRRGAKLSRTARPAIDLEEAHRVYVLLLRAATSRNQSDADFARNLEKAKSLPRDATGYAAWMLQANTLHHREWHRLNEARHHMRMAWDAFFRDWDVLLCPAAATTAFPHNQAGERWERTLMVDGRPQPSTTALFWAGFSGMALLPSTVIPAGPAADELPTGVQIVGPQYGDLTTLALARALEEEYGGFVPPPAYA